MNRQDFRDYFAVLYDLGHAHGKYRCKDVSEFYNHIIAVADNRDLVTYTNESQTIERQYLELLGFKTNKLSDRINSHHIDYKTLVENGKIAVQKEKALHEATEKATEYFSKFDTTIKEGDFVLYLGTPQTVEYRVTEIIGTGDSRRFRVVDHNTLSRTTGPNIDGTWPPSYWTKRIYTEEQFQEKVKEFL